MRVIDYLVNRTEEFSPEDSVLYKEFFHWECSVAFGILFTGAYFNDKISNNASYIWMGLASVLATDLTIRALLGNHGEKPVSGLIGLLRNLSPKKSN